MKELNVEDIKKRILNRLYGEGTLSPALTAWLAKRKKGGKKTTPVGGGPVKKKKKVPPAFAAFRFGKK